MSIVSVFALLALTMLLGMVMNVGRAVDGKLRMQNAADAAAYSGGVVIARGMNALSFTNHLLCEVFAMTAIMREAKERNAESYVPRVLSSWNAVAPLFDRSGFDKFERLGAAIPQKTPLEQEMVSAYGDWAFAVQQDVLPLFETILGNDPESGTPISEGLIPLYQRAVRDAFPQIAQTAVNEIARRNGEPDHGRGPMVGAFWRTTGALVGDDSYESVDCSLPVVDPIDDVSYADEARAARNSLAHYYLNEWNAETMAGFDFLAKMSQFGRLWRSFTCGQLEKLLDENYDRNLPFQIRVDGEELDDLPPSGQRTHLDQHFAFVGVTYWRELPATFPGVFRDPSEGDALAYAQVLVFVPRSRLEWQYYVPSSGGRISIGGVPGQRLDLPGDDTSSPTGEGRWVVGRQHVPEDWNLWNQHWMCQLVPATGPNLAMILQSEPQVADFSAAGLSLPNLGDLDDDEIMQLSPH